MIANQHFMYDNHLSQFDKDNVRLHLLSPCNHFHSQNPSGFKDKLQK